MALLVGYVVGARAGEEGFDELVASVKALRSSEQFAGLVTSMRSHAGYLLQETGRRISEDAAQPITADAMLLGAMRGVRSVPPFDRMVARFFENEAR